jgi:hypothetical protein
MAFEGNLETMPIADLLQWAANGRQTGTIRVSCGETTKKIYIETGRIVSCTSDNPKEFLGHFMVSRGIIDESQLQEAFITQDRFSGLLGQILVKQGAIDEDTLNEMLRLKAEEAIFELFTWEGGHFTFHEGELPDFELVPISLDVQGLVLEGMRRLDEWARIREVISSELCVPVAVRRFDLSGAKGDPGAISVLQAVDDDRTVADICLHTHSSEFFVSDILYRQAQTGALKFVRPRSISRQGLPAIGTDGHTLLGWAREQLDRGDLERCVRYLQAAISLEPNNRGLVEEASSLEAEVRSMMASDGVDDGAVPVVSVDLDELASLELEPSEGFLLSRIDGTSSLASILKISPLPEIDALLVVWRLVTSGQLKV